MCATQCHGAQSHPRKLLWPPLMRVFGLHTSKVIGGLLGREINWLGHLILAGPVSAAGQPRKERKRERLPFAK